MAAGVLGRGRHAASLAAFRTFTAGAASDVAAGLSVATAALVVSAAALALTAAALALTAAALALAAPSPAANLHGQELGHVRERRWYHDHD